MQNIRKLKAVYKDDLLGLLEKLEIKEEFETGHIYCKQCGQTISHANIGLIIPSGGVVEFVCNSAECIEQNKVRREEE